MLSFLRHNVKRTPTATQNTIYFEEGAVCIEFHAPNGDWMMTNTLPPNNIRPCDGKRTNFIPPLHLHTKQTEDFEVHEGAARIFADGEEILVKAGGTLHVPINTFHRYENASADTPLRVSVRFDEQSWRREMMFFRNFFGYLEDCRKDGVEPSVFQLTLMLHEFDTPLGLMVPVVGRSLSWFVTASLGMVGRWVLGYQVSYPEYYQPEKQEMTYGAIST